MLIANEMVAGFSPSFQVRPNCRAELYYARVFVKLDGSNKQVDSDHMHGITTDR